MDTSLSPAPTRDYSGLWRVLVIMTVTVLVMGGSIYALTQVLGPSPAPPGDVEVAARSSDRVMTLSRGHSQLYSCPGGILTATSLKQDLVELNCVSMRMSPTVTSVPSTMPTLSGATPSPTLSTRPTLAASATDVGTQDLSCPAGKKLAFSDAFDGDALNTAVWDYCLKQTHQGTKFLPWTCVNGKENMIYTTRPQSDPNSNVRVADGSLQLIARREPYDYTYVESGVTKDQKTYQYTSGAVNTSKSFSFYEGYLEARIKFPSGKGMWGGFWSICRGDWPWQRCWPKYGEVDVIEMLGRLPDTLQAHVHRGSGIGPGTDDPIGTGVKASSPLTDAYHVYAVEWSSEAFVWYVDGREYFRTPGSGSGTLKPPALIPSTMTEDDIKADKLNQHYLILNLSTGGTGTWAQETDSTLAFPRTMYVDYVKVCK